MRILHYGFGLALIISCASFNQGYAQNARSNCSSKSRTQANQSMIDFQRRNNNIQFGGKYDGKPWIILPPYGETKVKGTGSTVGSAVGLVNQLKKGDRARPQKSKEQIEAISKVTNSLLANPKFNKLQPSDQYNIRILVNELQSEPIQFISIKDISERLLNAYLSNVEVHERLRKIAKIKTQEIDFLKVSSVTRMRTNRKPKSKKWHARMGQLWDLEKTFREAQLSLHYFASRAAVERVSRNLGYVPVIEYYLHPMIKLPPTSR